MQECQNSHIRRQAQAFAPAGERGRLVTSPEDVGLKDPTTTMGTVPGVPTSYLVLNKPAGLAGMPYPMGNENWIDAGQAGFGLLLSLSQHRPDYDPAPLRSKWLPVEDLAHGGEPAEPRKDAESLGNARDILLTELGRGHGVIVHCDGGRGRTGTVLGLVMVGLGLAAVSAQAWLDKAYRTRGKPGWPESPWQAIQLSAGQSS